jgi:hypothetical protein
VENASTFFVENHGKRESFRALNTGANIDNCLLQVAIGISILWLSIGTSARYGN